MRARAVAKFGAARGVKRWVQLAIWAAVVCVWNVTAQQIEFRSPTSATSSEATSNHDVVIELTSGGALGSDLFFDVTDLLSGAAESATDYTALAAPTTLTFSAGSVNGDTVVVSIPVIQDTDVEGAEAVDLRLSNPSFGALGTQTNHTATITDDETLGRVGFQSATSSTIDEFTATTDVVLVLSLASGSLAEDAIVNVTDQLTGAAASGTDYGALATPVTLTFSAGSINGATIVVPIGVIDDATTEGNESIDLAISAVSGSASAGAQTSHEFRITDDDNPFVAFETSNSSRTEDTVVHPVMIRLTLPFGGTIPTDLFVDVTDIAGDTATSGTDYANFGSPLTVSFPAGSPDTTTAVVSIPVLEDLLGEGDETIDLRLSNAVGGGGVVLGAPTNHRFTILDDEDVSVEFADSATGVVESTTSHDVVLVLSVDGGGTIADEVTVEVTDLLTGTATSATDYTSLAVPIILTFPAGSAGGDTVVVTVPILDDIQLETSETVNLQLGNPSNASLGVVTSHIVTISDDDVAPSINFDSSSSATANESTGNHAVVLVLSMPSGTLGADATADITDLLTGTADSGTDYTTLASPITVTFSAGSADGATVVVNIPVQNDLVVEGGETVDLNLSNPTGGAVIGAVDTHEATITDDDVVTVNFASGSSSVNEANTTQDVVVALSIPGGGTLDAPWTVDVLDLGGGTAANGLDYTAISSPVTVTFPAAAADGATVVVSVTILDDPTIEATETIDLVLANSSSPLALGTTTTHSISILDDDAASISFQSGSSSVNEGNTTQDVIVVLSISGPTPVDITFEVTDLLSGSAANGTDYTTLASPVTLTFLAGSANGDTQIVPVGILQDATTESDETIVLELGNPSGAATLGTSTEHIVTIVDDDQALVEFQSATSSIGESAGTLFVVVELSGGTALPADVTVDVADQFSGTAASDTDYTAIGTPQAVTFPSGSNPGDTQVVSIPITPDTLVEGSETLNLALSNVAGPGVIGSQTIHVSTITDDDFASLTFQASTSSVGEANTTHNVVVTLQLPSGTLPADTTVDIADLGSGTATTATDYTFSTPITVTFASGAADGTTVVIAIGILGDVATEDNETIALQLQNPSVLGALGATSNHVVSITDDDAPTVTFQSGASSVDEANTTHNIVVVLNTPSALPADVTIDVSDALSGSATSATDYAAFAGLTVTFSSGATDGETQAVPISILDDAAGEGLEVIDFQLSNPTGLLTLGATTEHVVTIVDDEVAIIEFQSATSSNTEDGLILTVVVEISSGSAATDATVDVTDLLTGSATSATDYTALPVPVTVTFPAGSAPGTTRHVVITLLDDVLFEPNETIDLLMSNPTGPASLGATTPHQATIIDDDTANFTFTTSASSVTEAATTQFIVVELELPGGGPLPSDFTVDVADIGGGSATSGTDYGATGLLTLTFAAGTATGATQVIPLGIIDDALLESSETVNLRLSNPSSPGQIGATSNHVITIVDDDFNGTVEFQSATSASAGESGTIAVVVELMTTGGVAPADIVVSITDLLTGSATSATDYSALASPITLTFAAGANNGDTLTFPINILPDALTEGHESVDLRITGVSGPASVGSTSNHQVTISDDDGSFVAFQSSASSVGEADTTHNVVVELTIPSGTPLTGPLTVDVTDLLTGSATSAIDFSAIAAPVSVVFPAASGSGATQVVPISILQDSVLEGSETINLQLSNVVTADGVVLGAPTDHTVTILDDENDGTVDFQLIASSINENNVLHFIGMILSLDGGVTLGNEVTVEVSDLLSGTATAGTDFTAVGTQTLSFPVGSTSGTGLFLQIPILDDTIGEPDETIDLALTAVSGPAALGPQTAHEVTILDNDGIATFQLSSSNITETNTVHTVIVELVASAALVADGYIEVTDLGTGSATSGSDYAALVSPVILTFAAGSTSGATQVVSITIQNDTYTEGDETINLRLASSGTLGVGNTSNHTVTINDDESDPIVQFQNSASNLTEATTTQNVILELTLPSGGTLGNNLTLDVSDLLTGNATSGTDYAALAIPETVTFPAGTATAATAVIGVPVINDFIIEGDETVDLRMSNPTFGALGSTTNHIITINDGEFASIGYRTATSSVGEATTTHSVIIDLTITGAGALATDLVISYSDLLTGTAASTSDYTAISTTQVTFVAGTGTSQTVVVSIPVLDDPLVEGDETINLDLQVVSGSATATTTQHAVTLFDDEAGGTINLQSPASSTTEANPIHFVGVVLSLAGGTTLGQPVVVEVTDQLTGTATSATDYTALATPIILIFPVGSSSGTALFFDIAPVDDLIGEGDETIDLAFTSITGPATAGLQTSHTATILDDDTGVSLVLGTSSVAESTTTHSVIVTLTIGTGTLAADATVQITDLGTGSATAGTDYTAIGTVTVTFAAGSADGATQVVSIPILDDLGMEGSETINLQLQNATGPPNLGATTSHVVTITDDDFPSVAFQSAATTKSESGSPHSIVVVVTTPEGLTTSPLTVQVSDLLTGTATSNTDYSTFATATLTFPTGSASGDTQVTTLTVTDDTDDESAETVDFLLASVSGGPNGILGATTTHTVTILDNDGLAVVKSVSTTNQAHTTGSAVTIGEIVTYSYVVTIPETASTFNLRSIDTLPANFTYEAGTVSVTTGNAGMSIASTVTTWTQPTLQIDLTTVANPANGDGSDDFLTVTYQALVANTATNEAGQSKTNTVQVTDFSNTVSDSTTVTIVEPDVSVTKTVADITRCDGVASIVTLGDVLEYSLVVTETTGIDAFDLSITDLVDEGLAYDTSFTPTVTGTGNTISAATTSGTGGVGDPQTITWSLALANADIDVEPSSSITITYRVTVLATATPSATLNNTATIGFSSIDGTDANERSNASAPGTNDYQDQASIPVSVKPTGTTHSIPASRRRNPTFIDAAGNITGPGGPGVLTANDTLSLTDGSGVTITGDGISGPPPAGAPDVTVVAGATATINTDGTASFNYGVVTINAGATLTITGDTAISFEQIQMLSGSTLILPDSTTLTVTGPCELNGGVGTANYVTIRAAGTGPLSINFQCSFTGDHFRIEDIGTGTITFDGDTQIDYAIFVDGCLGGAYIQYNDSDDVTWTNLAFHCDCTPTKSTIATGAAGGNVTVDGYAQTIATLWCGGDASDSETGGVVSWLNATPIRDLAGSLEAAADGGVTVIWHTVQETMVAHFRVERQRAAANSATFTEVGRVFATAEEFGNADYAFLDRSAEPGVAYRYRINVIDTDGTHRWYDLGEASASRKAAPAPRRAEPRADNTPIASSVTVTTPDYEVAGYAADTPAQSGTASKAAVSATGLYSVPGGDPVYNFGTQLPRLGDSQSFVFVREVSDYYTDSNVIWTGRLQTAGAASSGPELGIDGTLSMEGYIGRHHVESNQSFSVNSSLPAGPNWYYQTRINTESTLSVDVALPAPTAGTATIRVAIRTNSDIAHTLTIRCNDIVLGTADWFGNGHRQLEMTFAASTLRSGDNTVTLSTTNATSEHRLDWIEIDTPTALSVGTSGVTVQATEAVDFTLPVGSLAVDVTAFGNESILPATNGVVTIPAGHIVHVANTAKSLTWSSPTTLVTPSLASVQYLAVAPEAWLGRLQPIVSKHGMRTLLISLEDVNDIYGAGLFGPGGLVGLTQRAQADYLLLGAGTTYDYKNFEGRGTDLGIPTGWLQVREGMAATDDIYSANLTTAVGRLPARSSNELLNMVNKIVNFKPTQRVVLLADRDDSEGGVNRFSEAQASLQNLVPTVLIESETQDSAAVRSDLIAAIQSGARTVAFQGHAGFQEIGDRFVDVNNASSFPTSAWLLSTCLTGSYFINSSTPTLARTLMNTPNAGGAMVIASTRFGHADYEHQMITKALEIMAADGGTWGQILRTLKRDLDHETLAVFQLFGDPAMASSADDDPRSIILRSPQGGSLVGGNGLVTIGFGLQGEGWWDETLRVSYRRDGGPWLTIRQLNAVPGQSEYSNDWLPPTDGEGYQIKIEVAE